MTASVATSAVGPKPRLNPFAFPSETGGRFLLLILSAVAASLFAYNWIYFGVTDPRHDAAVSLRCSSEAGSVSAGLGNSAAYAARSARFNHCIAQITHPKGYFMVAGLAVLFLFSIVVYVVLPRWRIRRLRWRPFDVQEVTDELICLCHASDIRRLPLFVWNPLDTATRALAFGRIRRHYVALSGGLVALYFSDPRAFRSIVLHELAHLRNKDVDRTYFTMALWYAFVLVALIPLAIAIGDESSEVILSVAWRMAALTTLVYVTRNGVLRTREMYADARASMSGATELDQLLSAMPARPQRQYLAAFRMHPNPDIRANALRDTDRLLKYPSVQAAFAAGLVLPLVFREVAMLIGFYDTDPFTVNWFAALCIAPFVVMVIWFGILRAAHVAVVRGGSPARLSAVGLALGAGALLGEVISFQNVGAVTGGLTGVVGLASRLTGIGISNSILNSDVFGWGTVWAVGLIVSMLLFVHWMSSGAQLWLRHGGEFGLVAATWTGFVVSAGVLTVVTGVFFLLHDYGVPASHILGPPSGRKR